MVIECEVVLTADGGGVGLKWIELEWSEVCASREVCERGEVAGRFILE